MIMKQISYGLACLGTGFAVSVAVPVNAINSHPAQSMQVTKLSAECKQRTIQDNLVVICPDSQSAILRGMLPSSK